VAAPAARRSSRDATPATPRNEPPAELTELGHAFRRLFRAVGRMRGRETHLAAGEISHAQFELLIELDERGELSAGELASAARLSPGSVTEMLDGLAESGYVERTRSPSDRRVVVSRLTPLGAARVEAKRRAWQGSWEEALGGFSARELRSASRVLESLGRMYEQGSAAAPAEDPAQPPPDGRKPG
jgi:MarR family transcriptional regulator, organic hydroperoxide resistance regulator